MAVDSIWSELADNAKQEMSAEGHDLREVKLYPFAMMRYTGQLEDVEVPAPTFRLESDEGLDRLVAEFDRIYEAINRSVSHYREAGHTITELGMIARVEKVKPKLTRRSLEGEIPPEEARKGKRKMYYGRAWVEAELWEMDSLRPGNRISGPAIVEHPATTLVIPAGDLVWVDEWTILHYEHGS